METLLAKGYQLVIIEDEDVALAGGIPTASGTSGFFLMSMIIVLVMAIAGAMIFYFTRARYYRTQIADLAEKTGMDAPTGWNIRSMKNEISVMEAELAEMNVSEFTEM